MMAPRALWKGSVQAARMALDHPVEVIRLLEHNLKVVRQRLHNKIDNVVGRNADR
jgi:hypothetical protein